MDEYIELLKEEDFKEELLHDEEYIYMMNLSSGHVYLKLVHT